VHWQCLLVLSFLLLVIAVALRIYLCPTITIPLFQSPDAKFQHSPKLVVGKYLSSLEHADSIDTDKGNQCIHEAHADFMFDPKIGLVERIHCPQAISYHSTC